MVVSTHAKYGCVIMQGLKIVESDDSPYSFDHLISEFKWLLNTISDPRVGSNTKYRVSDAALGAFSVFFMQSPSFLANQIRNILDQISPEAASPMFDFIFNGLKSMGFFEHYRCINKNILIALDGVNF